MGKVMVGMARVLLLCAVLLVLLPAVVASQVSVTLQPDQGPVNTGVTATGTGWPAGTAVYIYFESQLIGGPVTPDTSGAFATTFCVPDRQPGIYPVFFTNGRENFAPNFTITAGSPGNCQITALPDLIPTKIEYNAAELVPGGTVTFDSGIQNAGGQGTGVFNVKWFVDDVTVGYGSHGGVPANSTVSEGNSAYMWPATAGTHTITFAVDVDNHVVESNESNNSGSVTVTVTPAPAQIWDTPGGRAPNLIVLVHGCCTDENGVEEWKSRAELIEDAIIQNQTPGAWEIVVWDWSDKTPRPYIWELKNFITQACTAYTNAFSKGHELADAIIDHPIYEHIHLIGYSAGANLIDVAAKDLKVDYLKIPNQEARPFIHLTFLDAYTPSDSDKNTYGFLSGYTNYYAEHYVDLWGGASPIAPWTNTILPNAFNFDITGWPSDTIQEKKMYGHEWPLNWYIKSIITTGFEYGFPLSLEGGYDRFNTIAQDYPPGKQCSLTNATDICVQQPGTFVSIPIAGCP